MRGRLTILALTLLLPACGPGEDSPPAPEDGWIRIAAGGQHTCAIQQDGSLWCWGGNAYGQVGDGTTSDRSRPVQIFLPEAAAEVTAGRDHTCALLEHGAVFCWGRNDYGQLGDGTTTNRPQPGSVTGVNGLLSLQAGDRHTCAVETGGQAWCWGANQTGQLGIGDAAGPDLCQPEAELPTACALTPQVVTGVNDVAWAGAGGDEDMGHSCALTSLGRVWCWGSNAERQLGDGTLISHNRPVEVSAMVGVDDLTVGSAHTCAALGDGTAYCWGRDFGDPFYISVLSDVARVVAGRDDTCAVLDDSSLYCWGDNQYGQLGDGSQNDRIIPTAVTGLFDGVIDVSPGGTHTCAIDRSGVAWCWGSNEQGQLGGTSQLSSWVPVRVGVAD